MSRIVVMFAVVTILPLASLAYMSMTLGDHGLRSEAERRLGGVATGGGKFVNEEMGGLASVVESFAGRANVSAALVKGPRGYDTATLGDQLNDLKAARDGTSVAFVTDPNGHLVAGRPDNPANVGQDFSFRDWYKGVKATGHTYVSDAFVSAAPGSPEVVAVVSPVRGPQGNVLGYIGANYGLGALQTLINDFAHSQDVEMTVVDKQGNIVAAPGMLPDKLTSLRGERNVISALEGHSQVLETKRNGRHVLAAYASVERSGWAVVAEVPARAALAPVSSLRVAILTSASVLGLVVIAGLTLLVVSLRERTRIEQELRDKEQETRAILNASTDAYITMNEEGRITAWSDQAMNTFGWRADEVIGRKVSDVIIPEEMRSQHEEGLQRYLETGTGRLLDTRMEVEALHRDGRSFPLELGVWVVHSASSTVFNAFCHDITERRQASDELAQARDKALEASRLKSEFVANMSHEIRTPMNGVVGMTSLLLHTDLTEEQREFTETISHSAEALIDVINDILDFSKIEAGRMDLEHVPFDVRSVVEGAGELLAGAAQAKGLELTVLVGQNVPVAVYGDPVRLRQVLLNLAGNAIKFTDVGEVAISCHLVELSDESETFRFEVADTGIGIPEKHKGRLFQSFSQVDTSSSRRHGGTGLGLVISKRLVELMQGEVGFESEAGKGSTFWFTACFERRAEIEVPKALPTPPQRSIRGLRVLVVDDNTTNRTILQKSLASWGADCKLTAGAREAYEAAVEAADRGAPYDLAIIDYNMPDVDGLELGRQMATEPKVSSTKRILLTSSGQRGEAESAADGGFVGYLTKPVRQSALLDCIVTAVGGWEERSDAEEMPTEVRGKSRILVAEDNLVNQSVTRHMLEKMGYEVDVVENGRQAVEAMIATTFAGVLMDCQMPEVDGYEATQMWRSREPSGQHVPIIAITAHAMEGDADRCLQAGMDAYLAKPVAWDELQTTLRQWIPTENSGDGDGNSATTTVVTSLSATADHAVDLNVVGRVLNLTSSGSESRANDLVDLFLKQTAAQLDELRHTVADGRYEDMKAVVHRMKGSCATFGASGMTAICIQFESLLENADNARVSEMLSLIQNEYDEVELSLRNYLHARPRTAP